MLSRQFPEGTRSDSSPFSISGFPLSTAYAQTTIEKAFRSRQQTSAVAGSFGRRDRGPKIPLVQTARTDEQAQHDREQLVLRGDAEPLIGALAVGQRRMQADAERLRDRLGAEAEQDAAADLLLARRQRGERRARRKQRGEVLVGRCSRGLDD